MKSVTKSWKTTLAGIMGFIVAAWGQLQLLIDDLPNTTPDWGVIVAAFILMIGLFTARDSDVSSEDAGATQSGALAEKQQAANR